MTPPAHRTKLGGPKRASRAGGRARSRYAGQRAVARLRLGPATGEDLTRLLYGDAPLRMVQALVGSLREQGYTITHDWEGYHLVGEPDQAPAGRVTRSPAQAIYALFTTRGNLYKHCDCGACATHVALFHQLTADNRTRYINVLSVCATCAAAFTDAETIYTMEEAYALVERPLPPAAELPSSRGRPKTRTHRPAHGRRGAAAG